MAAVLGIIVTGVPMILFNAWLKKQGDDEVAILASWALRSAEIQIEQTVSALEGLSARGVNSCRPAHLEAMRKAALLAAPVKEVLLIGPNSQIRCSDTGVLVGRHEVLSSTATANADIMLDVVRLSDAGDRFLRVRKVGQGEQPSLAALLPASLLLPQASLQGGRLLGYVRMSMVDGTRVGESGVAADAAAGEDTEFLDQARSQQYGFTMTASMARDGVIANYEGLRRIGAVVTGVIALVILIFALIFPRRNADNPMADIAKALLADEFTPYYHPIVDIQTGRLLGAEVLVRWRRSDGSFAEPSAFVSLMESNGLIIDLTRSLMRRVRDDLREALGRRPAMSIAFNVAPQHFDDALILNDIGSIFDGSPIKLRQIVLELTERHEVKNLTSTRRTIAALQGLGCKIAIDDVGTGHSGLSYILKLGVDIIKIDKLFVEAIGTEGHSKAIIETLIDLANHMRMDIIAEGVETFDQVSYLRERGIRAAQGYVFAPPLPAASFLQLLEAMDPVADASEQEPAMATAANMARSAAVA
jgi:sensor c-di-GMP phosphodiesterase-like protein